MIIYRLDQTDWREPTSNAFALVEFRLQGYYAEEEYIHQYLHDRYDGEEFREETWEWSGETVLVPTETYGPVFRITPISVAGYPKRHYP